MKDRIDMPIFHTPICVADATNCFIAELNIKFSLRFLRRISACGMENKMSIKSNNKADNRLAMHVSVVTIIVNLVLSMGKLTAGFLGKSAAMISDGIHSASDVVSTIVVMIGIKIAGKQPDKEHPYGHERMESIASIILAVILALTGMTIGYDAVVKIYEGNYNNIAIPGLITIVAAVISIVVKEWMYWYTVAAAKKIHSDALMADAWHHRTDAMSSVGSFVGIFGARMGYPIMDLIASAVICVFILKAAYDIFAESVNKMVDHACDGEIEDKIRAIVMGIEGVKGIDDLKTRMFGAKMYVDVEILVEAEMTLREAHIIAEGVHDIIENNFLDCKHCMVHVNPYEE